MLEGGQRGITVHLPQGFPTGMDAGYGTDWDLPSYGFSPASMTEGFQRASGKPFGAPAGAYLWPRWGLTRRLRRGWWGCRPEGGSPFFRSERKYQRKHAARRLREKGFYCPFCQRDSQRRARHSWRVISCSRARSCARLFPPSKWAGLFPFAAYRRSAPPQLALGRLK